MKNINIIEYMSLTRNERKNHLKLDDPCDERGLLYSYHLTGLLAYYLHTTIPKKGDNAIVCHGCNNAGCSNPAHLYWGSYKDNHMDQVENGTWANPHERTKKKYGIDKVTEIYSKNAKGNKGNRLLRTETHKENIRRTALENNAGKSNKGKTRIKIECPHCNKQGANNTMRRWHFDNCKQKL